MVLLLVWTANAGTAFLTASPLLVGGMVESLKMTVEMAGLMAASQLFGSASGALICFIFTSQTNYRVFLLSAIALQVFGELFFMGGQSDKTFLSARFLSGVGAGVLWAISCGIVAGMRYKESIFAALLFGQMIFGFIWFYFWTDIVSSIGFKMSLQSLSLLGLPLVVFLKFLPTPTQNSSSGAESRSLPSVAALLCLISLLLHYVANSPQWIYVERIGTDAGISLQDASSALSLSMIFGLLGTMLAMGIGRTKYRFLPTIAGILGIIIGTSLLMLPINTLSFAITTSIILMSLTFVVPFYQGFLAGLPNGSKMSMLGTGTLNIGLAAGPLIGSQIVSSHDFQALLYFCNLLYAGALISMCCAFYALNSHNLDQ